METLTKSELKLRLDEVEKAIYDGEIFIHPTDTIYGLGCKATDKKAVKKIREIKERDKNPFSIWAPDIEWIRNNCVINKEAEKWLKKLPGPYTLILKLKNKDAVAPNINPGGDTLGVRLPDHWFHTIVNNINIPIVTTSVNKKGQEFMTDIKKLDPEIKKSISFTIYEGKKIGRPSKIVHLEGEDVKIRKR